SLITQFRVVCCPIAGIIWALSHEILTRRESQALVLSCWRQPLSSSNVRWRNTAVQPRNLPSKGVSSMAAQSAPLAAVLVDVGGTLWPTRWPSYEHDRDARVTQLGEVLPGTPRDRVAELLRRVEASEAEGGEACVREAVQSLGVPADAATIRALRK